MRPLILFLLTLLFAVPVNGQDKRNIRGYNLQTENDVIAGFFGLKNEDKDYSGGFKFEFYTDYLNKGIFPFYRNRRCGDAIRNYQAVYIHGLGYTPDRDSFVVTSIVRSQRPYASLLAVGYKRVAVFSRDEGFYGGFSLLSDLFVGKVGTKACGNFQNFLHEYLTDSDTVMGWHNQIGNGGRVAWNYLVQANFGFNFSVPTEKRWMPSVYACPHVSYGNIFQNAGIKLSLTDQNPSQMGLFNPMRNNQIQNFADAHPDFNSFWEHWSYEIYFKTTYVRHNTLLMGMPFQDNSVYVVPKDMMSPTVNDLGCKLIFQYYPDGKNCRKRITTVYLEVVSRSREFDYGDTHIFGNIGVTVFSLE